MPAFTHDGIRYAFGDTRPGEAGHMVAVLIHGWLSESKNLIPLGEAFADYRIIAADAAGHGCSQVPNEEMAPGVLDVPGQARVILALLDALGVSRAVLVGHASGGAVAIELAAQRPDLAEAVIALDAPILPTPAAASRRRELGAIDSTHWREPMRILTRAEHRPRVTILRSGNGNSTASRRRRTTSRKRCSDSSRLGMTKRPSTASARAAFRCCSSTRRPTPAWID